MKTLYWLNRDLRLRDNPAFNQAQQADHLLCVFVVDPRWFLPGPFQCHVMGPHRWSFLWQSLMALEHDLKTLGQRLHIAYGEPQTVLPPLVQAHGITHLISGYQPGTREERDWQAVTLALPDTLCQRMENLTLFSQSGLPFDLAELPVTFSRFRRALEKADALPPEPLPAPDNLPAPPPASEDDRLRCPQPPAPPDAGQRFAFRGGEQAGLQQLHHYLFESRRLSHYKQTRNAIDDWDASSKLSPWLANGGLSPRTVASEIRRYEHEIERNESTYWLYFELLWREYFQWYTWHHGRRVFLRDGIQPRRLPQGFCPRRFHAWCEGRTDYPLVNACMNQLRHTGYLSNRARQIVASAFVNELGLDWRYGAAWFEEQLVDYDVASNYGNWQYQAGVGADPQGPRHFNLAKQAQQFDPDGDFVKRWNIP